MRYFLLLFAILIGLHGFCYTFTTYEHPEVIVNNYTTYPKISQLENIIFQKTYENEDIEKRLERLEKKTCARSFTGADLAWRTDNIISHIDQSELYNIPSKDLAFVEKKILGRSYKKDNLENRLTRLEQKMLGAVQSGKPDERYQTILTASNHYTDFGNNTPSFGNTIGLTQGNGLKNTLQNIFGSMFNNGYMTGFTPPISSYDYNVPYGFSPNYGPYGPRMPYYSPYHNYNRGYGNNGYHRSIRTNTGYYNSFGQTGSGCGINILD